MNAQAGTRYFCRILRSLIADHFEQGRRLEYRESVPEETWDPWPGEEQRRLAERVSGASRRLPAKDRRSLAAYFNRDAACSGPGLSRGNMRYRAHTAVRKLRAMVGEQG